MSLNHPIPRSPRVRQALAWSVHLFTATGAVCGLLAVQAIYEAQWLEALSWMFLAVVVDGVDGTFARLAHVKDVLPNFDGTLLDNVIDYFNYALVPALFLFQAELLPERLALAAAAAIALCSAYQFCQGDAKTHDHYFKGFPCYWNIVVFYLLALELSDAANLGIVVLLCVLIFVPIKYIYPTRTYPLHKLTLLMTLIWGAMVLAVLLRFESAPRWLVVGSLFYLPYYVGASLILTYLGRLRERETLS